MSKADVRSEVLANLLEEHGFVVPSEAVDDIADQFAGHLESEREMESYQFIGRKPEQCTKCKELQRQIDALKSDIEAHKNSVRRRHGLFDDAPVYVENGTVFFDAR